MIATRVHSEAELIELEGWFDESVARRSREDEQLRRDSKEGNSATGRQLALANLLNRQRLRDQRAETFHALLDLGTHSPKLNKVEYWVKLGIDSRIDTVYSRRRL